MREGGGREGECEWGRGGGDEGESESGGGGDRVRGREGGGGGGISPARDLPSLHLKERE